MGERMICDDCIHFYELTGCIHVDGTDNAATCAHFEVSFFSEDEVDLLFPECCPDNEPLH
jgi:hypothetical protein